MMDAAGLITARDGIAGPITVKPPKLLYGNQAENMKRWDGQSRAVTIEAELLSRLLFVESDGPATTNPSDGKLPVIDVHHVSGVPGGTIATPKLLSFVRPAQADFQAQTFLVENYADLRVDRAAEILAQLDPPTEYFASILGLRASDFRYTLEMMTVAQFFSTMIARRIKHSLACLRPDRFAPQLQPMVPTPGHGSLPSGHASEAFATATTLIRLAGASIPPETADMLLRQASRIAVNRTVAGLHFPADSIAGAVVGVVAGDLLAARATAGGDVSGISFDGQGVNDTDFDYTQLLFAPEPADEADPKLHQAKIVPLTWNGAVGTGVTTSALVRVVASDVCPPLKGLWDLAKAEWE